MKSPNKHVVSFLSGTALCLAGCCFVSSNDSEKVMEERPEVSSMTVTPKVPRTVNFCGKDIDLTRYNMYEGFDRELSSFTYFHSTTLQLFKRANRHFPIIEPILKANGIPDDFKYLAVIESNLNPSASSPAQAVGMWQLLAGTAKEYGLGVLGGVDERRHVAKSTEAACRYLNKAYSRYKDWVNVAASYNAGMGRISGELEQQKEGSSFDLWVVEETARYVFRIMAIKQIFENPYKYGFILHPGDLYKPIQVKGIEVSSDTDLVTFAKDRGISYADLKRFNLWLRDRKLETKGKKYIIDVPAKEDLFYTVPNTYVHDPRWVVK